MSVVNNNRVILSKEDWETLFPKSDYEKVQKKEGTEELRNRISPHSLKYLIALDQPNNVILPVIEGLAKRKSDQIHSTYTEHKLTALHIAIMKNRFLIVMTLLGASANIEAPDAYGWRPIHHAALVSDQLFQLLVMKGANAYARTDLNGTFLDLLSLAGLERGWVNPNLYYLSENDKEPRKMTPEMMEKELNLMRYTEDPYYGVEQLKRLWTQKNKVLSTRLRMFDNLISSLYGGYLNCPPKLIIKEDKCLSSTLRTKEFVLGLFAGERIQACQCVGVYTGKKDKPRKAAFEKSLIQSDTSARYLLHNDDATEIGSALRYANEGWPPNLFAFKIYSQKGTKVSAMITDSLVQEGESLRWNYGIGEYALKWGKYVIGNVQDMRAFFTKHSIEEAITRLDDLSILYKAEAGQQLSIVDFIVYAFWNNRIQYVMETPLAIIDLVVSKIWSPEDFKKLLYHRQISHKLEENDQVYAWIKGLLDILCNFSSIMKWVEKSDPKMGEAARRFILENYLELTVVQLIKALDMISKRFSKSKETAQPIKECWDKIYEELLELPTYVWHQDEVFPLARAIHATELQDLFSSLVQLRESLEKLKSQ